MSNTENAVKIPAEFKWSVEMRTIGSNSESPPEATYQQLIVNIMRWLRGDPANSHPIDYMTGKWEKWNELRCAAVIGAPGYWKDSDVDVACRHALAIHEFGWEAYVASMTVKKS